jgi:tungstate transport system substrate-binding protein
MTRARYRIPSAFVAASIWLALVPAAAQSPAQAPVRPGVLRLATTTSTDDSGLLKAILPAFEKQCACRVDVVAVGTGQALEIGRRGDADVVLVHAYKSELQFVAEHHARERFDVMYNDFVIVGPATDPAKIGRMTSARDAFAAIAAAQAPFESRGDKSGTETAERAIWAAAKVTPAGAWYRSLGQGMGETLIVANEQRAYTLTDRGTWLAMSEKLPNLRLLVGGRSIAENGDSALRNRYGVMAIDPQVHPGVNYVLAQKFVHWLVSPETQHVIGEFGVKRFGQPLFYPDSDESKATRAVRVAVGAISKEFTLADLRTLPTITLTSYGTVGVKVGPVGPHTWSGVALKDLLLRTDAAAGDRRHANDRILVTSSDGWTAALWWSEVFASVPRGAALYHVKGCNECHGLDAEGTAPAGKRPAPALAGRAFAVGHVERVIRTGGDAHAAINPYTEAQLSAADLEHLVSWLRKPTRTVKGDAYQPPPGRQAIVIAFECDGQPATGRDGLLQLVVGPDQFAGRYSHWVKSVELVR